MAKRGCAEYTCPRTGVLDSWSAPSVGRRAPSLCRRPRSRDAAVQRRRMHRSRLSGNCFHVWSVTPPRELGRSPGDLARSVHYLRFDSSTRRRREAAFAPPSTALSRVMNEQYQACDLLQTDLSRCLLNPQCSRASPGPWLRSLRRFYMLPRARTPSTRERSTWRRRWQGSPAGNDAEPTTRRAYRLPRKRQAEHRFGRSVDFPKPRD